MTVPSPCINVCDYDPALGMCRGCLRTLEEIGAWSTADDGWKRAVLERVKLRAVRKA